MYENLDVSYNNLCYIYDQGGMKFLFDMICKPNIETLYTIIY